MPFIEIKSKSGINLIKCILALQYLRQCLIGFCEDIVKQQHESLLKKLPKFQNRCKHCTLQTLLPLHAFKKEICPSQSKKKCFCVRKTGRQLCPNNGFCSEFFDFIVFEHRFKDPLWKNTDPRKWKDCFWSVAVCFISTQGYHDKVTADGIDCRGLLSIIINNLEFETKLQGVTINGENDIFKKAKDFANHVHHCPDGKISDATYTSGIKLIMSILQMKQFDAEDVLQKFQNDTLFSNESDAIVYKVSYNTEIKERDENEPGPLPITDEMSSSSNQKPMNNPRWPKYRSISERLLSYAIWPHRNPNASELCKAGFFFTGNGDLVRCYQCGIGLKDFCEEDEPLKEYVRHSGNCPYLLKYLGATQLADLKSQIQTEDQEYGRQIQLNAWHTHPVTAFYRHPEYQSLQSRLSSFTSWPQHMIQTPQQLADAGLFYTGLEDRVRCFACDGGLQRWDPEDDPWIEHCRWFPACPFARQQKGDEYIAAIQAATTSEYQGNSAQTSDRGLLGAIERKKLWQSEFRAAINEHKETCVEMGYQLEDFNAAVQELRDKGSMKPTIEKVINAIEVIKARRAQEEALHETSLQEIRRLRRMVFCMLCGTNNVDTLFLPCTHNRTCSGCAGKLKICPACQTNIEKKIPTSMTNKRCAVFRCNHK